MCANEDVDEIIATITKYEKTHEPGDCIIYISGIEKAIKLKMVNSKKSILSNKVLLEY